MKRRFDAYLAGSDEKQIGEVLFLGHARVVIRHRFASREDWDVERNAPLKSGDETRRFRGIVPDANRPGDFICDGSNGPPDDKTVFYGADHV